MEQRVYLSQVMHRRVGRPQYRFTYPVFSLLLDVDSLDDTARHSRLFRVDRWGLLAFHRKDHGPRDGSDLRPWAERLLADAGIDLQGGQILILAFPRIFGYGFDPLSLWYCLHADGSLRCVIAEVRNTFGEHHSYLVHECGRPMRFPARGSVEKVFHVSPLIGMSCRYEFRFDAPGERLGVFIRQFEGDDLLLVASQTGQGMPLRDASLARALLRTPLLTFKVMAAIHWQALKIWWRGARFHPKPPPPLEEVT